jgi:hypothetical protein
LPEAIEHLVEQELHMLVKYTKERASRAFDTSGNAFQFIPGMNDVPAEVWARLLKNRNFARDVNRGDYVIVTDKDAPEEKNALSLFENVRVAFEIIKETYDRKKLLQWRQQEDRKTVIAEIDAQIARIDKRVKGRSAKDKTED